MLMSAVPILICLTLHELAHGLAAYAMGDNTAKRLGRLTLNPLAHLDPIGTVMMVFFRFGYAKPVPVDPSNFKNPKAGMAVTALAGPLMNLVIAAVAFFLYGIAIVAIPDGLPAELLYMTAAISVNLAAFNLLPVPPLDGSKVLSAFLPRELYWRFTSAGQAGGIVLIALSYIGLMGRVVQPISGVFLTMLQPFVTAGIRIGSLLP